MYYFCTSLLFISVPLGEESFIICRTIILLRRRCQSWARGSFDSPIMIFRIKSRILFGLASPMRYFDGFFYGLCLAASNCA